jgi:hypothetical protein
MSRSLTVYMHEFLRSEGFHQTANMDNNIHSPGGMRKTFPISQIAKHQHGTLVA